jgi:uncharacterized repeat protein (TIGR01451 family)
MQDANEATVRRLWRGAGVVLATLAASAAMASGASAAPVCGTTGPQVCVDVAGTPATVSPSTPLSPTFVSYDVSVVSQAQNTVTHVTLVDTLPAGSTLVSATPSAGTCTAGAGAVSCAFGSLPSRGSVTATILVRAPEVEGDVTDTATVRFDEGFNDSPVADPKQDTLTTSALTHVAAVAGEAASLVPSGADVRLDTDPTHVDVATPQDPNIGKAHIPASEHAAVTATLNEDPAPFTCPKKQICRSGAWVHAEIPGTFTPALEFELHWSKVLVSKQQTVKNLAVLHTGCLVGCAVTVVSRRCSALDPVLTECLSDVVETATEFRATLHSRTNGYMR